MQAIQTIIGIVAFALIAPFVGGFLAGVDRKLSARMQGRVGPSVLQPFYDVRKLLAKERASVNSADSVYVATALLFAVVSGGIFFSGGDLLLCVFTITLSSLMFIIAAYCARSPYAELGASREILQVLSYEPAVLIMAVVFYLSVGSFAVADAFGAARPAIIYGWPAFLGLLFVLTIKLRKSPFDLSMAHHAHQEIVRGMTLEMSGPTLAKVEILHWCESVLFLGWVGMFFLWGGPTSLAIAGAVALLVFLFEIWIDNNFARVKWQAMLASSWAVALVAGGVNLAMLAAL